MVRAGLRVADSVGQDLAHLRLRRFPHEAGWLPVSDRHYVGMPEAEVNATGDHKITGISHLATGFPWVAERATVLETRDRLDRLS